MTCRNIAKQDTCGQNNASQRHLDCSKVISIPADQCVLSMDPKTPWSGLPVRHQTWQNNVEHGIPLAPGRLLCHWKTRFHLLLCHAVREVVLFLSKGWDLRLAWSPTRFGGSTTRTTAEHRQTKRNILVRIHVAPWGAQQASNSAPTLPLRSMFGSSGTCFGAGTT